jgi:electron transfer flavoprotein alpha subunit
MAILIVTETSKGKYNKASLEAISYGAQVAKQLGTTATLLSLGAGSDEELSKAGEYGVASVLKSDSSKLNHFDPQLISKLIIAAIEKVGADVLVMSHNRTGKAVAPRLSAMLQAGLVSGAVSLPQTNGDFSVRKNVFSGKAFAEYTINTAKKIITLLPNSVPVQQTAGSASVSSFNDVCDSFTSLLKVEERVHQTDGEIPLPGAELVVSAGRGLKGPENWGMVEDLAKTLGAATACSRPVSDIGWRPHHEHVGQTGIAIRPNLYIAIGISGAIQHLAGVNGSKVIVVINKDSEAPFFKAADYGIVGDAFEIVPKLNDAFRKFKEQNS